MENVIIALITGGLSFFGVLFTNLSANRKIENNLVTAQAITDTKINNLDSKLAELTDEVRKHNLFADRITKLEVEIENIKKVIST